MIEGLHARGLGQGIERDLIFSEPLSKGLARGKLLLDLLVRHEAALFQIHQQHFAGLQAALLLNLLRLERQHAGFRCHDEQAILGDQVACRAQTVAV